MERVEAILCDPFYRECLDKNAAHEVHRQFCRHTFQHLLDVARITYIVMLEGGHLEEFMRQKDLTAKLARELIYAAALLHDIGRWQQYESGRDHAAASAELAIDILGNTGFAESEIAIITNGIREHRKPADNKSILGEFLYRGDKLSRLCSCCEAKDECNKLDVMETARKALIY